MGPSKKKKKVAITSTACQAIRAFFFIEYNDFFHTLQSASFDQSNFELRATKISGVPHPLAVSPVLSLEI